ncbi:MULTISPECIES: DUF2061 domain-containing protein [unclassified Arsukibacterium]|uniref:DUF2061 domain-containing protein n=1 Tax=unclassified Arsukibacterium TaxID=2635278 RepID=UPI000C59C590|nr:MULTISPECIES: DUF2061 domain-containing protein [unclassified Arsukibacterium]MAA94747.1 hypothetical protein [Rheinheimera sp.]MBM33895.1 hypothetical protein [Rheinheimera sp.]HAW93736.1 hypothetical protein [Candidatus Azambacteria bacterium]|tara:strand:- start:58636 stop:58860 length:225 start_codon:yes stop_codon:yes gene_type:complete
MLKTTTFAIMHFTIAFAVTYAITGDLVLGGLVAVIEPAANTVAYFFHEKIWQRLQQKNTVQKSLTIFKKPALKW